MEDYQTAEDVKEEVVDCGFVEVDSHDVHQLCTACLCATRTTHTLGDVTLKQYYMNILTETQLEAGEAVLQSPRLCWECVAHVKRSVRFREQVQDAYRLLQPMLLLCDKEELAEFLQTSVRRPGRLRTCFAHSINYSAQDDDTQLMTATEHDDGNNAEGYLSEKNSEVPLSTFRETKTIDGETFESFCEKNIIVCVSENLDENSNETLVAQARKQVKIKCVTTINTPNSTYELKSSYVCDTCYQKFTSKTALERHIATFNIYPHNNKTVPSRCEDCVVVLCSDNQCSVCSHGHRLLHHIDMKTNAAKKHYQREKPFQCEVCHKSFGKQRYLIRHRFLHTGEKPFQCEVCHNSFAQQRYLIRHRRTHTGEKPFQCEVCHKSFAQLSHLICHRRTHTGEKPYQCGVCCKSFASTSELNKHKRTHTGEKPFQCEVCYKSFVRHCILIDHRRIHTGEKPFQCEVCSKSFARRGDLNKHRRIHIRLVRKRAYRIKHTTHLQELGHSTPTGTRTQHTYRN